jgi:predicted N-acyltransferase
MDAATLDRIDEISAADWNRIVRSGNPFLQHEFLAALEHSGSVGPDTGWRPRHLVLKQAGTLVGAMPLYEKRDSWGEFVFDWSWARAYEQAGLDYYPKLVCAIPFSPVTGPRILSAEATVTVPQELALFQREQDNALPCGQVFGHIQAARRVTSCQAWIDDHGDLIHQPSPQ